MIPLLVPRRLDRGPRDRLWAFTRPLWEAAGFGVFEGFSDDGPFNRGLALNAAAGLAGAWDVAVIADADIVLADAAQAREAATLALATGRLTYAHDHLTMLDEPGTEGVLAGRLSPYDAGIGLTRHPNTWSQALAVARPLWDAVGGFDERFVDWGWDDLAFMASCEALAGVPVRVRGDAYHLWHPTGTWEEMIGANANHSRNMVLGQRYLAAKKDRRAMLAIIAERP